MATLPCHGHIHTALMWCSLHSPWYGPIPTTMVWAVPHTVCLVPTTMGCVMPRALCVPLLCPPWAQPTGPLPWCAPYHSVPCALSVPTLGSRYVVYPFPCGHHILQTLLTLGHRAQRTQKRVYLPWYGENRAVPYAVPSMVVWCGIPHGMGVYGEGTAEKLKRPCHGGLGLWCGTGDNGMVGNFPWGLTYSR